MLRVLRNRPMTGSAGFAGRRATALFSVLKKKGQSEGANQAEEQTDDDIFGLNMLNVSFGEDSEDLLLPVPEYRARPVASDVVFGPSDDFGLLSEDLGLVLDVAVATCGDRTENVVSESIENVENLNVEVEQNGCAGAEDGVSDGSLQELSLTDVSVFHTEMDFLKFVAGLHLTKWPGVVDARVKFLDSQVEMNAAEAVLNLSSSFAEKGFAIVDSGAASCSEPSPEWFAAVDTSVGLTVNTAGGAIKADGLGKVQWTVLDRDSRPLTLNVDNALHLKKAERLLSVWQCVKQGHSVVFASDRSYLKLKGGREVPFTVQGKYWEVQLQDCAENPVEFCLWKRVLAAPISTALAHRRLGHASEWAMRTMKELNLLDGLEWHGQFPKNCKICQESYFPQASEQKGRVKSDEPGELISFDFFIPPAKQSSLYSVKAILGLRDDCTGMPFTYALASKSDLVKQLDVWYNKEVAPNKHITLRSCCCDHENVNLTTEVRA